MVIWFILRVKMVNKYLRCVNAQENRAGGEGMDGTTGCEKSNTRGGVLVY
jgi:hypothetical protein